LGLWYFEGNPPKKLEFRMSKKNGLRKKRFSLGPSPKAFPEVRKAPVTNPFRGSEKKKGKLKKKRDSKRGVSLRRMFERLNCFMREPAKEEGTKKGGGTNTFEVVIFPEIVERVDCPNPHVGEGGWRKKKTKEGKRTTYPPKAPMVGGKVPFVSEIEWGRENETKKSRREKGGQRPFE